MGVKTLHIEKVSEDLIRSLKVWAAQEGRTLRELVLEILRKEIEKGGGKK